MTMDRFTRRISRSPVLHTSRFRACLVGVAVLLWPGSVAAVQSDTDEGFLAPVRPAVEDLIRAHQGVTGFIALDPTTSEALDVNADAVFPASGLMAVPIMVDVFNRVSEGQMTLEDPLTMLAIDQTDGPGILSHMSVPRELSVWDAMYLSVTLSDHTGANLLIDKLRPRIVTERMRQLGLQDTRLFMPANGDPSDSYDPERAAEFGMGHTTPREMASLLAMMYRGELVAPDASETMLGVLRREFYAQGIRRGIPEHIPVAHKTGVTGNGRSDCGVVYGPNRDLVICTMTRFNEDRSMGIENLGFDLIKNLTRVVFEEANFGSAAPASRSPFSSDGRMRWIVGAAVLALVAGWIGFRVRTATQ